MVSVAVTGIPTAVIDKVFDPFSPRKSPETGLDISVVHGIVKQSHGYIAVESEPGKGSTITIYLPKILEPPITEAFSTEACLLTWSLFHIWCATRRDANTEGLRAEAFCATPRSDNHEERGALGIKIAGNYL